MLGCFVHRESCANLPTQTLGLECPSGFSGTIFPCSRNPQVEETCRTFGSLHSFPVNWALIGSTKVDKRKTSNTQYCIITYVVWRSTIFFSVSEHVWYQNKKEHNLPKTSWFTLCKTITACSDTSAIWRRFQCVEWSNTGRMNFHAFS